MTRFTQKPTHFTLPAILPAILTGLFILTACGGSALTNDAPIATNTQKNVCKTNPLADGCQAGAGFLSVNFDEDIGDQEAESSEAPPAPKPVVNAPAPAPTPTPVVTKTEPVLKKLAKKKTQPAPPPPPAPTTSVDTHDFTPQTSYSTQSAPASDGPSGQSSHPGDNDGVIKFQDWQHNPTTVIAAARDTTSPKNQFLLGGADELDRGDASRTDPLRMNLAQATYEGVAIRGSDKNGIDFFIASTFTARDEGFFRVGTAATLLVDKEVNVDTLYHYAGILSGTNLGEPVVSDVKTATWNGSFRTHNTNPVDFQLTVGFGAVGAKTISAFVKDNARWGAVDNYYLLAGTYDANGLITGTVNWGEFTNGDKDMPVGGNNGVLTGLIGKDGAVAVFTSNTPASRTIGFGENPPIDNTQNIITGKVFNDVPPVYGYVGGFVAAPSVLTTRVTYRDWFESFDDKSTRGVHETPSLRAEEMEVDATGEDILVNQFLGISEYATALDETGAGTVTQRGGLTLADDMDSGVSFFSNGISLTTLTVGSQSYAGLLAGTDLGAPINDVAQVGEWQGQFKSVGGYYYGINPDNESARIETAVDTTFPLTVTFGAVAGVDGSAGSIEAFVATSGINRRFLLKGTYDANGVITGTVLAGLFDNDERSNPSATINGTLTGLIGQAGAVGAFISNADAANYNYAGGFVAAPTE